MKNILIVEDDEFFLSLMAKDLLAQGFKVSKATSGADGIEKAKEDIPDLMLLDLLLPDSDGFEVISKLRAEPTTEKIPVIVLSNLSQQDQIERALKLGANDFLIKSQITSEEVTDKVKEYCAKHGIQEVAPIDFDTPLEMPDEGFPF